MVVAERSTPGGRRAAIRSLAVLLSIGAIGCATDFERRDGPDGPYLEHKKLGYSIAAAPISRAGVWTPIDLPEADLAFRNEDGTAVSLASRCRATRASVATLARQLTIGTPRDDLLAAGPIELRGADGWSQTFDTRENDLTLRIKAITLLAGVCIYDWLLVANGPAPFDQAEPAFDGWMRSFVPPPAAVEPEEMVDAMPDPTGEAIEVSPEPVDEVADGEGAP